MHNDLLRNLRLGLMDIESARQIAATRNVNTINSSARAEDEGRAIRRAFRSSHPKRYRKPPRPKVKAKVQGVSKRKLIEDSLVNELASLLGE